MHQKTKRVKNQGFTLVELMLAMGFVGSLLVMIALITIQIMGLYNKGLTLKEVNQVSRMVVRDMQQSIASVDAFRLQYKDGDTLRTPVTLAEIKNSGGNNIDYYSNPAGGRLCTGQYSYVWNTGAALKSHNPRLVDFSLGGVPANDYGEPGEPAYPIQFVATGGGSTVPARFIKKNDPGKELCRIQEGDDEDDRARNLGQASDYENVFGAGHNELVVYKFSIENRSNIGISDASELTALSTFYYINMTLGTQAGDEDEGGLISGDVRCKSPAEAEYNQGEYCAVNKIDFVARTGGLSR